jgi:hypothetical protein
VLARNVKQNPYYFFKELAQDYNGIYTFWFGSKPIVVITSIDLAKKALNQNECSDRWEENIASKIGDALFDGNKAFVIMNWTEEVKKLRKISSNGLRFDL